MRSEARCAGARFKTSDTFAEILGATEMPLSDPLIGTEARLSPGSMTLEIQLGARIHRRRQELGIELTHLSYGIDVPTSRLIGIETGVVRPSAPQVYDLAVALGLSITDLFRKAIPPSYRRA